MHQAQIDIVLARLDGNRLILTPEERCRLMKIGEELDHQVKESLQLVTYKTYQRWVREKRDGKKSGRVGRPRTKAWIRKLIVRLAKDNLQWGYRRIVGEMLKLRVFTSKPTVQRVLDEHGIYPEPSKSGSGYVETNWQNFIRIHINTLVACDFFCKTVLTQLGKKTAYCLAFIHLGSRKVFISPSTYHPTEQGIKIQSRNVTMWFEDNNITVTHLIRDRDGTFPASFNPFFKGNGVDVIKTPVRAPNANAYCEAWVGSIKRECLNYFLCFSLKHLDFITHRYEHFYNKRRPHQSKGNRTLSFKTDKSPPPLISAEPIGKIKCERHLGGLLKHYYHAAA